MAPGEPAATVLESIEWKDKADGSPDITFTTPLAAEGVAARVAGEGEGEELKAGNLVSFDWVQISGADGAVTGSSFDGTTTPGAFTLDEQQMEPNLLKALVGQKVGVKVLYLVQGASAEGQASSPSVIGLVVKALAVPLTKAEGEAQTPKTKGIPTVTLGENGAPTIEAAKGEAPKELVKEVLIKGDGPLVESGQTAAFHYSGWLWDGTSFDSSWDRGAPFSTALGVGQVIKGWDEGLVGVPVGSQVLLVIPPDLGYGDQESGSIPANSTLVFVVDILAAV